ncbi:helix-turn-helix transcriptional regulator [Amycolatopsis minnesotensis]|uniref:Helix-turn-helix transcriptional regulator n=1 Tax=Amycolatopsis minnesotensis TaxID=337894 RepID=A0ABN2QGL3_9PSEU
MPDGCLDLIVSEDRVFVAGPDTRASVPSAGARSARHGIRFSPGHAPLVLGVAADELLDQRVELSELWGREGARAAERLLADPRGLPGLVSSRLDGAEPDPEVALLVRRLELGVPRVADATGGLGLSERALRRRFTVAVGYGPATYLRVSRLQRAIAMAPHAGGLAALAAAAGYADQAHLSRECRALTGRTAAAYFGRSVQDRAAPRELVSAP